MSKKKRTRQDAWRQARAHRRAAERGITILAPDSWDLSKAERFAATEDAESGHRPTFWVSAAAACAVAAASNPLTSGQLPAAGRLVFARPSIEAVDPACVRLATMAEFLPAIIREAQAALPADRHITNDGRFVVGALSWRVAPLHDLMASDMGFGMLESDERALAAWRALSVTTFRTTTRDSDGYDIAGGPRTVVFAPNNPGDTAGSDLLHECGIEHTLVGPDEEWTPHDPVLGFLASWCSLREDLLASGERLAVPVAVVDAA